MTSVQVYVADAHPIYRAGLASLISDWPNFDLLGQSSNGGEALTQIRELRSDVAILDAKLPGLDGREVLDAIEQDDLETKVVFISSHTDANLIYEAVAAGAGAFLSKEAEPDAIREAISAVAGGEVVLSADLQGTLATAIRARAADDRPVLTSRQNEVLALVAEGHTTPEIGRILFLSPTTVKTHLQHLYERLGVSDRAAAVAEAMRRNLLE